MLEIKKIIENRAGTQRVLHMSNGTRRVEVLIDGRWIDSGYCDRLPLPQGVILMGKA